MTKVNKIKGFSDIISPLVENYCLIEGKAREIFSSYGFQEIRLPVVEKTELFARSIGGETDIVQKEMYTFADRKGRSLTLRPEATAGMVRAFIENKFFAVQQICKLFTFGPMFRYERPQKGRLRQFNQIDVEIFGPESPLADVELILCLKDFLDSLDILNLQIDINSLGCKNCRSNYHAALTSFLAQMDSEALCPDCQRRQTTNPLRVLDCKVLGCQQVTIDSPKITDYLCPDCEQHFAIVLNGLNQTGVHFNVNHRLVRGLDYYQRTTFEVLAKGIGAQSAIAGGGRYDGLVKDLGGPDVPGLGFACGLERLSMLMKEPRPRGLDFYLAPLTRESLVQAQILANRLRLNGFSGQVGYEAKSLKSQLRLADKLGARVSLLLGETELNNHVVLLKDMQTGIQKSVDERELEVVLSGQLKRDK